MDIGQKVKVTRSAGSWLNGAIWWPANDVTGTVTRICKNGSVYVAMDQFANSSDDGKLTKIFSKADKVTISPM